VIGYFLDTNLSFDILFISAPIGALLCVFVGYTYVYEKPKPYYNQVVMCKEEVNEIFVSAALSSKTLSLNIIEDVTNEVSSLRTHSPGLRALDNECEVMSPVIEQKFDRQIDESTAEAESLHAVKSSQNDKVNGCMLTLTLFKVMVQTYSGIGFLVSSIALNVGTSVVENLIFLYFQTIGTSYTICGVSVLVTVLFEVPIFYFAPRLLDRFGPEMLQKIACLAYIVRVVGYTLIPKNYGALVLLFEPLHGVTYGCAKTSRVDFAAQSSVKGYESSSQGVLSLVFGIGSLVGLAAGGLIEESFGPVILYRAYAIVVSLGLILFYKSIKLD